MRPGIRIPQQAYQMCSRDVISTDKRTTRYVYSAPQGILTEALKKACTEIRSGAEREIKRAGWKTAERDRVKGPETERQKQRQAKRDRASENERGKRGG